MWYIYMFSFGRMLQNAFEFLKKSLPDIISIVSCSRFRSSQYCRHRISFHIWTLCYYLINISASGEIVFKVNKSRATHQKYFIRVDLVISIMLQCRPLPVRSHMPVGIGIDSHSGNTLASNLFQIIISWHGKMYFLMLRKWLLSAEGSDF